MKAWNRSCEFWVADDNSWWDQKTYVTSCSCVHRLWCADIIPCFFVPQWRPECDWQCSLYLQCVPEGYWQGWLHSDPRRCQWSGGEDVPHLGQSCGEYYFFIFILINLPSDLFLQGKSFFLHLSFALKVISSLHPVMLSLSWNPHLPHFFYFYKGALVSVFLLSLLFIWLSLLSY